MRFSWWKLTTVSATNNYCFLVCDWNLKHARTRCRWCYSLLNFSSKARDEPKFTSKLKSLWLTSLFLNPFAVFSCHYLHQHHWRPISARLSHDRTNKLPLHLRPQQTAYTNWRASLRWESRTRILATLSFEAKSTTWRLQLWRQRSAPRPLAVGQLVLSNGDNPGAKSYRSCEKRTRVSGSLTRGGCQ